MRLILDVHCLYDQQEADCGQGEVDVFQEGVALEAVVEGSAQKDGDQGEGGRGQGVGGYRGNPEASQPVADHADQAGGQKISLQGSAEVGRGPASHGAVDDEWRGVSSPGFPPDNGNKTTT